MIRDAVAQFDDKKSKGWIQSLNELSTQMVDFSSEISRQGGNLNQIIKRTNELIYMGELDKKYYDEVIFPQVKILQKLMNDVKKQQSEIFKRLLNLWNNKVLSVLMLELRRHFPHVGGQVAFSVDLKNRRLKAQLATQLQTGCVHGLNADFSQFNWPLYIKLSHIYTIIL